MRSNWWPGVGVVGTLPSDWTASTDLILIIFSVQGLPYSRRSSNKSQAEETKEKQNQKRMASVRY